MLDYNQKIPEFLKQTAYCDSNSPAIEKTAVFLTKDYSDQRQKAVALFSYVRDSVLYTFDYWNIKASETLEKKTGMCTNKNNLLIALLRAINIPAGYGILKVKGKEYFGPLMLPTFKKLVSESSVHIYSLVNFDNKWIKCDVSPDKEISKKTSHLSPTSRLIEWNGIDDAMEYFNPKHIIEDISPISNIDTKLDKKPDAFNKTKMKLGNLYLKFLRNGNNNFKSISDVEKEFKKWLRKESKFFYSYYSFRSIF